jgi:RNA polymerase sigma factor (TIGR02999 family)
MLAACAAQPAALSTGDHAMSSTPLASTDPGGDGGDGGDHGADTLFNATYRELRRLAHARLRTAGRDTLLDTTGLVHESYERMLRAGDVRFPDRPRFLGYAGQVMRSIIVDFARHRQAARHGGGVLHVTLTTKLLDDDLAPEDEIVRVHEALESLARVDARMASVVEMRYFGGFTDAEIALALGVTDRTVRRDWEHARLFLANALRR